jgi:hypothetical protein
LPGAPSLFSQGLASVRPGRPRARHLPDPGCGRGSAAGATNGCGWVQPRRQRGWCRRHIGVFFVLGAAFAIGVPLSMRSVTAPLRFSGLPKASTWPLLAAMNRSRYSHSEARKGALIFLSTTLNAGYSRSPFYDPRRPDLGHRWPRRRCCGCCKLRRTAG